MAAVPQAGERRQPWSIVCCDASGGVANRTAPDPRDSAHRMLCAAPTRIGSSSRRRGCPAFSHGRPPPLDLVLDHGGAIQVRWGGRAQLALSAAVLFVSGVKYSRLARWARPRPAGQAKHFIAPGWTAVHADFRTSSTLNQAGPPAHVDHMRTTSIPRKRGTFTNDLHIRRRTSSLARDQAAAGCVPWRSCRGAVGGRWRLPLRREGAVGSPRGCGGLSRAVGSGAHSIRLPSRR